MNIRGTLLRTPQPPYLPCGYSPIRSWRGCGHDTRGPSSIGVVSNRVIAEPITNFDQQDPSRQRFGQLEFRGGLILKSTENSAPSRQLSHPMALSSPLSATMAGG